MLVSATLHVALPFVLGAQYLVSTPTVGPLETALQIICTDDAAKLFPGEAPVVYDSQACSVPFHGSAVIFGSVYITVPFPRWQPAFEPISVPRRSQVKSHIFYARTPPSNL